MGALLIWRPSRVCNVLSRACLSGVIDGGEDVNWMLHCQGFTLTLRKALMQKMMV